MGFFDALTGVAKVLGGLGGLFGGDDAPSPGDSLMSHAIGAREAAKRTGFNPLTLLGVSPAPWAAGPPPLASVDVLTSGLKDVADVASGRVAREDAARKLQLDLAKLELEAAKANLAAFRNPSAVRAIGGGPGTASLGAKPMVQPTSAAVPVSPALLHMGEAVTDKPVTDYTLFGLDIKADPRSDDAEIVEKRGGEIGGEIAGVSNMVNDVGYTFGPQIERIRSIENMVNPMAPFRGLVWSGLEKVLDPDLFATKTVPDGHRGVNR